MTNRSRLTVSLLATLLILIFALTACNAQIESTAAHTTIPSSSAPTLHDTYNKFSSDGIILYLP